MKLFACGGSREHVGISHSPSCSVFIRKYPVDLCACDISCVYAILLQGLKEALKALSYKAELAR